MRWVRRGKSTGGPLRSEIGADKSVAKYRCRVAKIGMKVLWIKAPVLALSVLGYRARSLRNGARSAPKCLFLQFLASTCIFEG